MTIPNDVRVKNAEFDCPFIVGRSGTVHQGSAVAPCATHDDDHDILIDGIPYRDHPTWDVFSVGYTGQHGYNGGVMHSSEFIGGRLLTDILETEGTYVVVAVEDDEDRENAPVGWTVLRLRD